LGGADLRGADLGGADLGDADLGGADLRGADLGGADFNKLKSTNIIVPECGSFIGWKKLSYWLEKTKKWVYCQNKNTRKSKKDIKFAK